MFFATSRRVLYPIAFVGAVLLSPSAAMADPFAVKDTEGFGIEMTALTMELPPGWNGQGRIAWTKPCSANELYETILTATSPDGQSGLRIMPGHQVNWSDTTVDRTVDPAIAQMVVAQAEAARNQMRTAFQNSNCHVGQVAGTEQILQTLILSKRPADVRVVSMKPNEPVIALYKSGFGAAQTGMIVRYESQIIEMAYTGPAGPMVERLWLTWYQFSDDPQFNYMAGVPTLRYQNTTIASITFAYAPAGRAADLDTAAAALATVKADTGWTAKVREVQERINEERRRAQKERSDAADQRHKDFIDMIRQ